MAVNSSKACFRTGFALLPVSPLAYRSASTTLRRYRIRQRHDFRACGVSRASTCCNSSRALVLFSVSPKQFARSIEQPALVVAYDADGPRRAIGNAKALCAEARLEGEFEGQCRSARRGDFRAASLRDLAFENPRRVP